MEVIEGSNHQFTRFCNVWFYNDYLLVSHIFIEKKVVWELHAQLIKALKTIIVPGDVRYNESMYIVTFIQSN